MLENNISIKIGDFVTSCEAGYWQLIDIKPKIADEDYSSEKVRWKKGDIIGQWVILKKAFTPKMKPRIDFSYVDSAWIQSVSAEVLKEIEIYFAQNPDYKLKYDNADIKLRPMITNLWINLPEGKEDEFRLLLQKLPSQYTMAKFWRIAKKYEKYVSDPPTNYLLNFFTYPWNMDKKANLIYSECELLKV